MQTLTQIYKSFKNLTRIDKTCRAVQAKSLIAVGMNPSLWYKHRPLILAAQ